MRHRPLLLAALVALGGLVGGTVTELVPVAVPEATAADVSITLDGHGNGHGVGLSQWGAYGYAVDQGWTSAQILDHYYGNTVAASVALDTPIRVRLQHLDAQQTSVAVDSGSLLVAGLAGGPWKSVLVRETATQGTYAVWARADTSRCPSTTADPVAAGWSLVNGAVATKVEIRTAVDSSTVTDRAQLLSTCEPDTGTVRWYRGTIRAVNDSGLVNRTVNVLPLEQYLRTVIAMEMSPGWADDGGGRGAQALRAQAVAARSYALAYPTTVSTATSAWSDVCDMVCQSYFGVAYQVPGQAVRAVEAAPTDAAVLATAGVVRKVTSSGAIALTMFSASNGGYSATNNHPLTPFPAVPDTGDATALNPNHTWAVTLTGAAISAKYPEIGTFVGLTVNTRNGFGEWGGRVLTMTVNGSAGSTVTTGATFRSRMGLKDTWFNVRGASLPPPPPADACAGRVAPPVTGPMATKPAARFTPITPVRILDTRIGAGTTKAPLLVGCTMVVKPAVPAAVTSVVVDVTSIAPAKSGAVFAYACGTPVPTGAAVQAVAGRVVGATNVVALSADHTFCVTSTVATEVAIDMYGTYSAASGVKFQPVAPTRLYDSRSRSTPLPAGTLLRVKVAGTAKVPVGATAAALTVQGLSAVASGSLAVYPCSATRPTVASLYATKGVAITNHLQVGLHGTGVVCIYVAQAMHVVVDVSGWFGAAATTQYFATNPVRVVDTRKNLGLTGAFATNSNRAIVLASRNGLPAAAGLKAVMGQVTAVGAAGSGWLTVHPCNVPVPNVSMVRYAPGTASATGVAGIDDASGRWCVAASAAVHVLVDVDGWYA